MHLQRDIGMLGEVFPQAPVRHHAAGRRDGADAQHAPQALPERRDLTLRGVRHFQDAQGALVEYLAGVGKARVAGAADDQLRAELLFQLRQLVAQRGLADMEPPCCSGDLVLFGNGHEVPQLFQVHMRIPI